MREAKIDSAADRKQDDDIMLWSEISIKDYEKK